MIGRTLSFDTGIGSVDLSDIFTSVTSAIAQISTSSTAYMVTGCGVSGTKVNVLCRKVLDGTAANNVDIGIRIFAIGIA